MLHRCLRLSAFVLLLETVYKWRIPCLCNLVAPYRNCSQFYHVNCCWHNV